MENKFKGFFNLFGVKNLADKSKNKVQADGSKGDQQFINSSSLDDQVKQTIVSLMKPSNKWIRLARQFKTNLYAESNMDDELGSLNDEKDNSIDDSMIQINEA